MNFDMVSACFCVRFGLYAARACTVKCASVC